MSNNISTLSGSHGCIHTIKVTGLLSISVRCIYKMQSYVMGYCRVIPSFIFRMTRHRIIGKPSKMERSYPVMGKIVKLTDYKNSY